MVEFSSGHEFSKPADIGDKYRSIGIGHCDKKRTMKLVKIEFAGAFENKPLY